MRTQEHATYSIPMMGVGQNAIKIQELKHLFPYLMKTRRNTSLPEAVGLCAQMQRNF